MALKKLSESDKQDILTRYRQTEDTAATLASRYGVSTSTVSRILKQTLPEDEYESLIHQKRSGSFRPPIEVAADIETESQVEFPLEIAEAAPATAPVPVPIPRQRKRIILTESASSREPAQLELTAPVAELPESKPLKPAAPVVKAAQDSFVPLSEAGLDDDELDEEDLEEDDLDELDDDDLDDDDAIDGEAVFAPVHLSSAGLIKVLPLSEALIPKTCYIVVDRASELITHPLKDFADLGQIPSEETQAKTLPVFDNHRVAKRFLRRMQRVVKVPDGKILQKVSPYLQAKGITRLLIDGQIYSV